MATATGTTSNGIATTGKGIDLAAVDLASYAGTFSPDAYAVDTELISAFGKAATVATAAAIKYQGAMGALAVTILNLSDAGTWQRQIDGNTGQTYTSAKAFYTELFNRTNKDGHRIFSPLHKLMRDELMGILIDEDGKLAGIGTNELAELIGCSPAQVTRSVAKAAEQKALESAPRVVTDEELDKAYTTAVADAVANGADEDAAAHAGEQARAELKSAVAYLNAPENETEDQRVARELAESNKAKADADKAARAFIRAVGIDGDAGVHGTFYLFTDERLAEVHAIAARLVSSIEKFDAGYHKVLPVNAPAKPAARGKRTA